MKEDKLKGRLSLKDLIIAKFEQEHQLQTLQIPKVDAVNVNDDDEDVANIMRKIRFRSYTCCR